MENTINVYFVPSIKPGIAGLGGQLFAMVANLYALDSTFPHEIGHSLNLLETHQARLENGVVIRECPDGSNCSTAGDLICDTPADPGLSGLVTASCVYTGTATSQYPCTPGQTYSPDTHNIMSYSLHMCRNHLSEGQSLRMRRFLETSHPNMINIYPQSFYVNVLGGDDNNNIGTEDSPFLTIGKAVSVAMPNDTVKVEPGTYTENVVVDGKTLVIKSDDGPTTNTRVSLGSGTAFTFTNHADGSVLEGLRIIGGDVGVRCVNSAVIIKRCIFDAQIALNEGAIVLSGSSPATILNNTILRAANWGILTYSSSTPTIKNNIVSHNKGGICRASGGAQPLLSYNDVWSNPLLAPYFYDSLMNYSNIADPGVGAMNQDPYVDSSFCLVVGTPCANAGDPATIYNDPDGTRACMGALWTAYSRVVQVSPTGDGAIQAVIDRASSGWVIEALPGTYYENLRYWGKTVKVRGKYGPTQTFLRWRVFWVDIMVLEFGEGPGSELSGFDVSSASCWDDAIHVLSGANLLLQNCVFHNFMTCGGSYNFDVLRVGPSAGAVQVKNCVFYGNRGLSCINALPGSPVTVINNTFHNNNRAINSNSANTVARNNIVTNSLIYGVSGTFSALDYNDIYNNTVNYAGGAVAGGHDISLDPLFVNAATYDFHLQENSPCINAGDPNPIYNDPDGTRNDMGAYYLEELIRFIEFKLPESIPGDFVLEQNIPNPFNPSTDISFNLPGTGDVRLEIYNVLGQRVSTLLDQNLPSGWHTVRWEGTDDSGSPVASGIYLYRLTFGTSSEVKKMLLLK